MADGDELSPHSPPHNTFSFDLGIFKDNCLKGVQRRGCKMRSSCGEGVLTQTRATNISMATPSMMTDITVRPLGEEEG